MTDPTASPWRGGWLAGALAAFAQPLTHRNYRLFFAGQLVSLTGTWMQRVALAWLVYRLTGSPLLLGLVGFIFQFPIFALATLGGVLADRIDRHRIVLATQIASMALTFVLAALTLGEAVEIWHILVLTGLLGVVNAFDIPARQAFVITMVGRADLPGAIALNSAMLNGARIVGPAVGGVVVALVGEGWCFFLNGVSYIAVVAGLLLMTGVKTEPRPAGGSPLRQIAEGFHFAATTDPYRGLLALLGLTSLVGMPYFALMPIFAADILRGGATAQGLLLSATGVGALIAAPWLAAVGRDPARLAVLPTRAAAGFGIALVGFALSRNFWLSMACLVPVGFFMMAMSSATNARIQSLVPDHLRGRVMAVWSMMFMGMMPFGALLGGWASDRLGAPMVVAGGGVLCVVGAVLHRLHGAR